MRGSRSRHKQKQMGMSEPKFSKYNLQVYRESERRSKENDSGTS